MAESHGARFRFGVNIEAIERAGDDTISGVRTRRRRAHRGQVHPSPWAAIRPARQAVGHRPADLSGKGFSITCRSTTPRCRPSRPSWTKPTRSP